jgi:hypothetical protein
MAVGVTTYSNVLSIFTQKLCVYIHQDAERPQRIMTCPMLINRIFWSDCIENSLCVENPEGRLCEEDLDNLKKWTISVFPNQAKSLTNQGYDDLKFMARRFKSQFPNLLNHPYNQRLYEVSWGGEAVALPCQLNSEIRM